MRYLVRFLPWYSLPRKPPYPTLPRKPPAPTLLPASNACLRPYAPATAPLKYCMWWARGAGGGGDSSSSIAPALIVVVAQSAVVVAQSGSVYSHFSQFFSLERLGRQWLPRADVA